MVNDSSGNVLRDGLSVVESRQITSRSRLKCRGRKRGRTRVKRALSCLRNVDGEFANDWKHPIYIKGSLRAIGSMPQHENTGKCSCMRSTHRFSRRCEHTFLLRSHASRHDVLQLRQTVCSGFERGRAWIPREGCPTPRQWSGHRRRAWPEPVLWIARWQQERISLVPSFRRVRVAVVVDDQVVTITR
jgi:hypothetical protein